MAADKVNGKLILENADRGGRVYRVKPGWTKSQVFAGVLCCFLILTIPLGIWIIRSAKRARLGLTDEGFAFTYLGTIAARWSDVETISLGSMNAAMFGGGLIGVAAAAAVKNKTQGLKGPINVKLRDRRIPLAIPAHTIENSLEMAREMERLSGIRFIPAEAGISG